MTESTEQEIEARSPADSHPLLQRESLSEAEIAILSQRAERLRQQRSQVEESEQRWLAVFPVGEDQYALPLESLRAALPLRLVSPVPLSPPGVVGIVRHGGEILTVLSLASLLGCRGWRQDPAVLLILETEDNELVACDCEQVPVALAVPAGAVAKASVSSDGLTKELNLPDNGLNAYLIEVPQLLKRLGGSGS